MKTFEDLEFKDLSNQWYSKTQARMDFENGYGVSVITGSGAYGSGSHPYEVAVMLNGSLCYDTPITDDVIGYNDESMVTEIMKKVQELPTT
jgi:hypothetical protein